MGGGRAGQLQETEFEREVVLAPPAPPTTSAAATLEAIAALALVTLWCVLKTYGLRPAAADENIYFYFATRIAEAGKLPYRDFFFAHPPLHLVPAVLLVKLAGGFSLVAMKALPGFAALVAGLALWRATRTVGRTAGLVALALWLFSYDVLRASSHFTGANWTAMWLALGLLALTSRLGALGGLLLGAACGTGLYAVPASAAVLVALAFVDRRRALTAFAAWTLTGAALVAGGFALGGQAFWDEVVRYHLKKTAEEGAFLAAARPLFALNPLLLWGAVLGAAAAALALVRGDHDLPGVRSPAAGGAPPRDDRGRALLFASFAGLAVNVAFIASLARVYAFYFALALACAAPLAGFGYSQLVVRARRFAESQGAALAAAALAALAVVGVVLETRARRSLSEGREGEARSYRWSPSPLLPAWLDAAVKATLWRGDDVRGEETWAIAAYLRHESHEFGIADELARRVRQRTAPGTTIFGDSTSTPLVALLAGRALTFDEADTNLLRFLSGATGELAFLEHIAAARPMAVVAASRRGLFVERTAREWLSRHFVQRDALDDAWEGQYTIWTPK